MAAPVFSNENRKIPLASNDQKFQPRHRNTIKEPPGPCRFETYLSERVGLTSSLWSGGDWHWRLVAPSGLILADCGGYPNESKCLEVIEALRANAPAACAPLRL